MKIECVHFGKCNSMRYKLKRYEKNTNEQQSGGLKFGKLQSPDGQQTWEFARGTNAHPADTLQPGSCISSC